MAQDTTQKKSDKATQSAQVKAENFFIRIVRKRRFWMIFGSIVLLYFSMVLYYAVKYRSPHLVEASSHDGKACSHVCRKVWHLHFYEVDDYLSLIGIIALIVGIIAAWEAYVAASKSEKIEDTLIEIGLLTSEVKGEFKLIFKNHLIKYLNLVGNCPARIYLAISTPSYGYAVLGQKSFEELYKAFEGLDGKNCSIEIVLFSPDAHFHYWSNLLMWSIEQEDTNDLHFAINFAQNTKDMLNIMRMKESKIWLMRETTVRFFAYSYYNIKIKQEVEKAYFSLVDRFSIYQNQFKEGFQATSLPVVSTQIHDYIEKDKSFFERIKVCPYSQKVGDAAAISFENYSALPSNEKQDREKTLNSLLSDFLLGRTYARQIANFRYFKLIINNYLVNLKLSNELAFGKLSDEQIFGKNFLLILEYFGSVIINHGLYSIISQKQLFIIQFVFFNIKKEIPALAFSTKTDDLFKGYQTTTHDSIIGNDVITEYTGLNAEDKIRYLIFLLLTSGFEESTYAAQTIAKAN